MRFSSVFWWHRVQLIFGFDFIVTISDKVSLFFQKNLPEQRFLLFWQNFSYSQEVPQVSSFHQIPSWSLKNDERKSKPALKKTQNQRLNTSSMTSQVLFVSKCICMYLLFQDIILTFTNAKYIQTHFSQNCVPSDREIRERVNGN